MLPLFGAYKRQLLFAGLLYFKLNSHKVISIQYMVLIIPLFQGYRPCLVSVFRHYRYRLLERFRYSDFKRSADTFTILVS